MEYLPKIPSEFIEPYIKKFLVFQIESVGVGLITPQEARDYLKGVEYFISAFAGIHASIATSNIYGKFNIIPDEEMIKICRRCVMETVG